MSLRSASVLIVGSFLLLSVSGCKKKVASVAPPAPKPVASQPAPAPAPARHETPVARQLPAAPAPAPKPVVRSFADVVAGDTRDALFEYDKSTLRQDARTALTSDADALKKIFQEFGTGTVVVEGHCDERGSAEYNLALGDRRATTARDFLVEFGVPKDRLKTISYGKERPLCSEHNEDCWQKNRRAHLTAQ